MPHTKQAGGAVLLLLKEENEERREVSLEVQGGAISHHRLSRT